MYYSRIESTIDRSGPPPKKKRSPNHRDESDESDEDDHYCYRMFQYFSFKCSIVRHLDKPEVMEVFLPIETTKGHAKLE